MVFHWSLSDSKSPQATRTLLSILINHNDAVVCISKSLQSLCVSFAGLDSACTICSFGQISIYCTIASGSSFPSSRVSSYTLSVLTCCIRLLCVWSFRLYPHITSICCFVASYLFLLWYIIIILIIFHSEMLQFNSWLIWEHQYRVWL